MSDHVRQAAQRVVNAENTFDAITKYVGDLPDGDTLNVRIDWQWGSSCTGYKETNASVQRLLQPGIRPLIMAALEEARRELHNARRDMWLALESIRA